MSGTGAPGAQDAAQKSSSTAAPPLPPPHHPHPHHPGETRMPPEPSAQDAPTSSCTSSSSSSSSAGRVARTWVRFAKAFVLIFPVYALGYFEFSVSWLLIGLAIFFFWRRNSGCKSSRLSRALAFLQQQQQEMEMEMKEEEEKKSSDARALDTPELPSWVHFPDVERVEWVNKTVNQIWPYACRFLEKLFRQNIEPAVKGANTHLSTFSFTRIELGDKPLRVNGVKVYTENVDTRQIIMDLQISFVANTEIEMDIKRYYCKAGIKSIQLHGVLRVVLEPLMGEMPLVGAFSLFFLKKPLLDIGWAGLTNILDIPGLNGFSDSLIQDVISSYLVLPNRITVPLVGDVELEQLRFPMPKGVLRIHFLEAQDLEGKDKFFGGLIKGKSDPYGVIQVANQIFQSKTIKECLNPKWNEVFEATVYEHSGQHLEIELFDEDPDKDDFLGSLMIDLTKLHKEQKVEEWFDLEEVSSGKLHLRLEWLSLQSVADKLQQALWSIRTNDSLSSALLMVYLDSARNLPSVFEGSLSCGNDRGRRGSGLVFCDDSSSLCRSLLSGRKLNSDPSPYVQLTVGQKMYESKVRYKTCEPLWEEAFTFLVHNPHTQELQVEVKDDKHKCTLGNMRVALACLLKDEDMTLVQQFPLNSSGPNSTLKLKLVLRILCLEKETTSGQPSFVQVRHTSQGVTMSQTNTTTTTTTTTTHSTPTTQSTSTTHSTPTTHTTPCNSPGPTGVTLRGKRGSEGSPVSLVQTEMQRDSPRRDSTRRDSTRRDSTRRNSTRRDSTQRESTHRDSTQSLASDASLPSAALELQHRLSQLQNGSTQYPLGEVQLTIRHSSQRNKLIVVVHACRNLISLGKDGSDPYIRLYLLPDKSRSGRRKTSTMRKNLNPVYDQSFEFIVSAVELHRRTLDVAVKNAGGLLSKNKGLLGKVLVDLASEEISKGWTRWYDLSADGS
ncbi:extended synaptotagmin-2 isoform X2 [Pangasianodon hypophthalmus]|uniref:extended synaptotagmin-2 isoform X2 n=1 Tax=Pangasianodon hypophthalmus TaxID=310915 RepID=UPI002306EECB|nr:extended synaptotagmin-2 isoform X2 [Pangasianodon hypophthalmus]